jgi:hypothetical protein
MNQNYTNIDDNGIYKYTENKTKKATKSVDNDYLESNLREIKLNTSKKTTNSMPNWVIFSSNSITGGVENV